MGSNRIAGKLLTKLIRVGDYIKKNMKENLITGN
jgi:hypothetical protein